MAISERLQKRFKDVPGVTPSDIADWMSEAKAESGIAEGESISGDNALVYLAYAIGCQTIATSTAHYFSFSDGNESVDKTKLFENYLKMSVKARKQYVYHRLGGKSKSYTRKRADGR